MQYVSAENPQTIHGADRPKQKVHPWFVTIFIPVGDTVISDKSRH